MIPGTDREETSFHLGETQIGGASPAGSSPLLQLRPQKLNNNTADNNGALRETNWNCPSGELN